MENVNALAVNGIPFDPTGPSINGQLYYFDSTNRKYALVTPLAGTKVYYVSDSSGGAVTRKLTFTNGILTAET